MTSSPSEGMPSEGMQVRTLTPDDDRSAFDSGDEDLDRFFRKYAGQNQFRHHLGVTYVATAAEALCGFVTVSASSLEIEDLPKRTRRSLPRYPLPVLRVARLAVDRRHQGRGVGRLLLRSALQLARGMASDVGCVGVVVDAKPQAVSFYERFGFEPFEVIEGGSNARPMPRPLFLPLGSIPAG